MLPQILYTESRQNHHEAEGEQQEADAKNPNAALCTA